jgi:hypothetical protein
MFARFFRSARICAGAFEPETVIETAVGHYLGSAIPSSEVERYFSLCGKIFVAGTMTEFMEKALAIYRDEYHLTKQHIAVCFFSCVSMVRPTLPLEAYNWHNGVNIIRAEVYHLCGGASSELPSNVAVAIENLIISNPSIKTKDLNALVRHINLLQADSSSESESTMWTFILRGLAERFEKFNSFSDAEVTEWSMNMTENVIHSIVWFQKTDDLLLWAQLVYKLFTGRSSTGALLRKWDELFGSSTLQMDLGEGISAFRTLFDTASELSETPLVQKVTRLYNFLLVQGCLSRMGLELSEEDYSKLEIRTLSAAFSSKKGLWIAALDAIVFLTERIYEFYETKDICVFVHSDAAYSKWSKEADRLVTLSNFTANLEVHGTNYFAFVSDISETIEKGEAYAKFSSSRLGVEPKVFRSKLNQLKLIKATELTRKAAQQERPAPLGVLIHGPSSVAKSSFSKMLFYYYGKLFDLPTDDNFRYVRSPTDEYWSNFDSSKWCIQLDDIAFVRSDKCSEVDPTLKELLCISNQVPFCPPQARLEDKGMTPVKAELITATTNSITLNAFEYFHCPLAVQRRLPFVISVVPKAEYLQPNGRFIDPTKLPEQSSGFPDYWTISLYEIHPILESEVERAQLNLKKIYENVNEFLIEFGATARKHKENQEKAMSCDKYMKTLEVCKICMGPKPCDCSVLQVGEETVPAEIVPYEWVEQEQPQRPSVIWSVFDWCVNVYANYCLLWYKLHWFSNVLQYMVRYRYLRWLTYQFLIFLAPSSIHLNVLGFLNSLSSAPRRWSQNISTMHIIIGVITTGIAVYGVSTSLRKTEKEPVEASPTLVVDEDADAELLDERLQGTFGTSEHQLEKEERQNVWYNPTVELSRFDLPLAAGSLAKADSAQLRDIFSSNCVRLDTITLDGNVKRTRGMSGVFVKGHNVLTNSHLFLSGYESYTVRVTTGNGLGLNTNVEFKLMASEIKHIKDKDLCMFSVTALPARKDITKFWAQNLTLVTRLTRLGRNKEGNMDIDEVYGVNYFPECFFEEEQTKLNCGIYRGSQLTDSKSGDCGSLCIATTPRGCAIIGIHALGIRKSVGEIQVNLSDITQLVSAIEADQFVPLQVEAGVEPVMEVPSKKVTVQPLHYKSLTRYIPEAKLQVFGTLSGFRPRPKSSVCATPLQEEMCEHFGSPVAHCAPVMNGWEPWHNNLVHMVQPNYLYDRTIINKCADSYFRGAREMLPRDWESELCFLSDKASVNGLPGVRYIDGLNRSTSMGFPWACTKTNFLREDPCEKYPDGVTFSDEVWERVRAIEACYARGECAYPIFTGHLKDEAVAFLKRLLKKTRVFTAAPADWSIVVRSRLLPFVRLMQKHKIAFEAAIGVVCQSVEWEYMKDHITKFGLDQMVGGDFEKYDKKMTSDFILAAFSIVAKFYLEAGASPEQVREIMCIGEDTAFSFCSFNGDLIQFLGTNPSGHPLTVVINSIVNSLYMRYVYYCCNPANECMSFKEFVALLTYGDDNFASVSKTIGKWFNHTTIQKELKTIGVSYTMPDKTSESVPFTHFRDASFLKRMWRYDVDVEAWLCPLEEDSIKKSLTVWTPSNTLDEYSQMVAVITSANNEYFYYGREVFEKHHLKFQEILAREPYCFCNMADSLPNWAVLVERYHRASCAMAREYGRESDVERFGCLLTVKN